MTATTTEPTIEPATGFAVRAVARYVMAGPDSVERATQVMHAFLDAAVQAQTLVGYTVTGVHPHLMFSDFHMITFTADVDGTPHDGASETQTQEAVTAILNEVVEDSDVEVDWIYVLRSAQ